MKEIQQDDNGNNLPEYVDVIASGYEWVCPACDKLNKVIAYEEKVKCQNSKCGMEFETYFPEHCVG